MDRDTDHPLTPEEAKVRLRAAAQQLRLTIVTGRGGWSVLAAALAGGFIAGRMRLPNMARTLLMRRIAPALLAILFGKRRGK
jgi:hypothetical protein